MGVVNTTAQSSNPVAGVACVQGIQWFWPDRSLVLCSTLLRGCDASLQVKQTAKESITSAVLLLHLFLARPDQAFATAAPFARSFQERGTHMAAPNMLRHVTQQALGGWPCAAQQSQLAAQQLPQACDHLLQSIRQLHGAADTEQPSLQLGQALPAYPTHVPLHPVQKGAVALLSALGALVKPARGDLVAVVGETFGDAAVRNMAARMRASPTGRQILAERPRVTDAAVGHCWDLPANTFGGAYARFMGQRGFYADDRPAGSEEDLAYVITRAREVHDFWHVLFDCHTNVFGELALKALEFVQTGLPMAGMAVAGAQFKLSAEDRRLLWTTYMPWAAQAGLRSADLMCLYYEQHLQEDLQELRARWRITPAPQLPERLLLRQSSKQLW
ncbi:coenzyme Q biosynthesis protein Coq4-domain-containing protein [Scenedesmus sp. NREL 46B-D3]|nr:coenzyme Q biosynthesis protein Coq4-domain-containing protein [Scenedesmus sp. NREL 46B-D3]